MEETGTLDAIWASPEGKEQEVLAVVNSTAATEMRTHWGTLVNLKEGLRTFLDTFPVPRFNYVQDALDRVNKDLGFNAIDAQYAVVRDRICELSAGRAWARPRGRDEAEAAVLAKAVNTVKLLEGTLPATLAELIGMSGGGEAASA